MSDVTTVPDASRPSLIGDTMQTASTVVNAFNAVITELSVGTQLGARSLTNVASIAERTTAIADVKNAIWCETIREEMPKGISSLADQIRNGSV